MYFCQLQDFPARVVRTAFWRIQNVNEDRGGVMRGVNCYVEVVDIREKRISEEYPERSCYIYLRPSLNPRGIDLLDTGA
jgi:hypothetical protein